MFIFALYFDPQLYIYGVEDYSKLVMYRAKLADSAASSLEHMADVHMLMPTQRLQSTMKLLAVNERKKRAYVPHTDTE